jgi:tetratricopeptide (TPR) repeat protein
MVGTLNSGEEAQLQQTIEMFEVITQSQPQDVQSLEILKEAYYKLGREKELIETSKRIAQAYVLMGQISSAILEYEGILQRFPDDADTLAALGELESKASSLSNAPALEELAEESKPKTKTTFRGKTPGNRVVPADFDDGRETMSKIFVEGKVISAAEFDLCWITPELTGSPGKVIEPFIQLLAEKGYTPLERSLRIISDKGRIGHLPLEKYDIDIELARRFAPDTCQRWCVLPFDRMSKSILVATCNPFNRHAAQELEETAQQRLLWYLAPPSDISKVLRKIFR